MMQSGRPIPASVIDSLDSADESLDVADDSLGTIGTYAIRVAEWTYVGKTEVGFDSRFQQHKNSSGLNQKYRILKETGLFDYAHFVPLTRTKEAYEVSQHAPSFSTPSFLTVLTNLQVMQETTGKRVPTDSSLIAIFEIFDIASFDTTDARRGFNQNLVDDAL
jgi:hypothetical protein